jgi:2-phosphosulfolactate phosphatase
MDKSHFFDQHEYDIRCEWGTHGVAAVAAHSDVFVIVDVLSFSTCVDIAVGNGALIYPYALRDDTAHDYARSLGALLASSRRTAGGGYSLSPTSLLSVPSGTRLVLPSPNGATLSRATGAVPTLAGCLRNARNVARAARTFGRRISVIPAGERWPDGSIRPAIEDWLGAGAIISHLGGTRSPEAALAATAYEHARARDDLWRYLSTCGSGRELIGQGYEEDVRLAADLDVSTCVPVLRDGAYVSHG